MAWTVLKHHRIVLEMLKLTPNKRLGHTTTQDNAMQRCLLQPWKIYNYTKAVHKLLLDLVAASPSRMPTMTGHQANSPPVCLKWLQNSTSLFGSPLLSPQARYLV